MGVFNPPNMTPTDQEVTEILQRMEAVIEPKFARHRQSFIHLLELPQSVGGAGMPSEQAYAVYLNQCDAEIKKRGFVDLLLSLGPGTVPHGAPVYHIQILERWAANFHMTVCQTLAKQLPCKFKFNHPLFILFSPTIIVCR